MSKTFPSDLMTKLVVFHHLPDNNDRPALERWFWQDHCPEVLAQAPWMTRYHMYRCQPAPPGAGSLGTYNYRIHENWVRGPDSRRGTRGLLSMSQQPAYMDVAIASFPAEPTEDFKGAELRPHEKTILRWMVMFRYPDGVDPVEADDWYLQTHIPELCAIPGLTRCFSHQALRRDGPAIPMSSGQRPFMTKKPPLFGKAWHRLTEMWFENDSGWVDSFVTRPPTFTPPPWATHPSYPFLRPGDEFVGAFILERPDEDLMRSVGHRIF